MLSRRALFGTFGLLIIPACGSARPAAEPYSPAAFEAAASAGRPILVEITAPWCPTCKAQKPILSRLLQKPEFAGIAVFQVDFDGQKAVVRAFQANLQSTLITFKGRTPAGRSVGDTRAASIEALLKTAVE